ncbi:hypothetical protein GH721_08055 [Kriegella sp. EG-1]|nr:hypothetical protein [Flavobacteriaceae bacterium EG-1]
MRNSRLTLLIALFAMPALFAQIKIGDNPQAISPTSVLELESNDRVLVITRINTTQMNAIVPNQGAMVYNTDTQCIHYFDGAQWVNLCNSAGFELAENSVSSIHVIDFSITGDDIQNGSIGPGKLQNESVTQDKLGENSVGAYALDNANIGVTAFDNDAGYITAADLDIVSAAAGNVITDNGGAYYDDSFLIADIAQNAADIALDNDTNANNEIQTLSIAGNILTLTNPSGDNVITLPSSAAPDGSETIVNQGTNVTITGNGTTATPYVINATGGTGSTEIADQTTITGIGTAADPFTIEPGGINQVLTTNASGVIEWQAGGTGGTTEIADQTTITGIGTAADPFTIEPGTNGQFLTTDASGDVIWQTVAPGVGEVNSGNNIGSAGIGPYIANNGTVLEFKNINSATAVLNVDDDAINNEIDISIAPGTADGQILEWDTTLNAGAGGWNIVAGGSGTINEQSIALNEPANEIELLDDDGTTVGSSVKLDGTSVEIANNGTDDVIQIAENGVTLDKLAHPDPAAVIPPADGDVMVWDNTAQEWTIEAQAAAPTGTANAIFFADNDPANLGKLTTADNNLNTYDDGGFYWDSNARDVGGNKYGALFVGLNGDPQSDEVKVHIADSKPGFAYALELQNRNNPVGTTTGILFSTEGSTTYGKGGLVYERTAGYARGDFHFLQNSTTSTVSTDLADKAFSVQNNKDIIVYGGINIDGTRDGLLTGIGTGTAGQVLTSTGNGIQWTAKGSGTSPTDNEANDGLSEYVAATGYNINVDDSTIGIVGDELIVKAGGITATEIGDDEIGENHLKDNSVGSFQIINESIVAEDLNQMGAVLNNVLKWNGSEWAPAVDAGGSAYSPGAGLSLSGSTFSVDDLLGDVTGPTSATVIANDAVTVDKIAPSLTDGQILKTNGTDVIWSDDLNIGATDLTLTTNRTLDLNGNNLLFSGAGGIGIGTLPGDPLVKLRVNGQIRGSTFRAGNGGVNLPAYRFENDANSGMFLPAVSELGFSTLGTEALRIDDVQNVGIGTGTAINANAKLHVKGNIYAENGDFYSISGGVVAGIPDYVFQHYFIGQSKIKPDYNFKSLEEIEAFIKTKHHLPGIKSAATVKEEGEWNLTASNIQNLEKIEELFLHTIEQENKIKSLQTENEALSREVKAMKKDLEEIKALLKKEN